MATANPEHLTCTSPHAGIKVVRFTWPDLRPQMDDERSSIADCTLYRELEAAALADLRAGDTLILNFGLVEWYVSVFHRLLLKVREAVQAKNARLLLCCLTPIVREGFDLFGGSKVFDVLGSESRAVSDAKKPGPPPRN